YRTRYYCYLFFFVFQAEDGIRDRNVTGVQTCALPIFTKPSSKKPIAYLMGCLPTSLQITCKQHTRHPQKYRPAWSTSITLVVLRSEERRVGKECRTRRSQKQ